MSVKRRNFNDRRYVYSLTFSVFRRRRLFDLDYPQRIVLGVLNHQLEQMQGKRIGSLLLRRSVA